jgi:hypothetical protein
MIVGTVGRVSLGVQPISGLPEIGHLKVRKSGKPDLRARRNLPQNGGLRPGKSRG